MVTASGASATVVWDERVTPSDQVRLVGVAGVSSGYHAVTTSDASAPTFAITDAQQTPGLGGDTITVEFSGPRVAEAQAEDPASWTLTIQATALDLAGSTFDLDPGTQVLSITLGTMANLHASFTLAASDLESVADVPLATAAVAGAATGDAVAPSLVSVEQNLAESEFGFVVDFTFDEAMDPVFSLKLSSFYAGFPVFASQVEQPSEDVLRVTFTAPIVPGLHTIDLSELVDAHGNPLLDATVAVVAGSTVANAFDGAGPVLSTVANVGRDTLVATFVQAIAPSTAELAARWALESPVGTPVDLSGATFDYDLLTKTLSVGLDVDLVTGDDFRFGPSGTPAVDVDGEDFADVFDGTVTGDATAPDVLGVVQNRSLDPTGLTYDVALSEDVDAVEAETTTHYAFSNGALVQTATLQAGLDVVRLVVDQVAVPGDVTVDVQALEDLAGNALGLVAGIVLTSTDASAPSAVSPVAMALEGVENDTLTVVFDDLMIEVEVADPDHWIVESPVGSALDTTGASVAYDAGSQQAVLTFDGASTVDLQTMEDFTVRFVSMRDIAGNLVDAAPVGGTVAAEETFPALESAWVEDLNPGNLHVRFSEPCDRLDDIGGLTEYVVHDGGGLAVGGPATVVVDADRLGATLMLGFGVTAGVHTLDVRGVTDVAGNPMFPASGFPISSEDSAEPGLDVASALTAVEGEANDEIEVVFDRPLSRWGLLDPAHYALTDGMSPVDLDGASFAFDGDRTVTIRLDGGVPSNLVFGQAYTLDVGGILSVQGVAISGSASLMTNAVGDSAPPSIPGGRARLDPADAANSVLVDLDEAIDAAEAADPLNFAISAVNPDTTELLGHRTVRATFSGGVAAGQTIDVTMTDLAGNAGLSSQVIQAADVSGPVVTSVTGVITPGVGGDRIEVVYDEPIHPSTGSYTVTVGGSPLSLAGAFYGYESGARRVLILLPDGTELTSGAILNVQAIGVSNLAGISMSPPANLNGGINGDSAAPGFSAAFANLRADAAGTRIDVLFDEDVDATYATDPLNWAVTGGQAVSGVLRLSDAAVRLTLSAALGAGDELQLDMLPDTAGNLSGAIAIEPLR
jgi:hypothetical protein